MMMLSNCLKRTGLRGAAMALWAACALALSGAAFAQQGEGGYGSYSGHSGRGGERREQGGGMFGGGGLLGNPEHMGRLMDRMLDGLNATDAQRSQLKQIAQAAGKDMRAQREGNRALREKAMQIFSAPNVDVGAAEQIRQQMTAQHDQMSKRTLQAMLDASKVLSPEQRAKLGERIKQRSDSMRERIKRMRGERGEPKS